MKNKGILFIIGLLVSTFLVGCASSQSNAPNNDSIKLSVYTSFYPMYDFAKKIGGDKIDVTNLVPAGTEPHDWEPTPTDIASLEKADIFIYNGLGMEHWVDTVIHSLQNKELMAVETSKGIDIVESNHNEEEETDSHVWLSPINAKKQIEAIKNAFVQKDPENKAYYEGNYNKYVSELEKLDKEFKDALSPLANKDIIVAHQAFGYLCKEYGLNQIAIEGLTPDSEPSPARMTEITKFAKEHHIRVIFFEELVSPKVAETIARNIGAKTEVLNPLEGLNDEQMSAGEDYFTIMRKNLKVLKAALE